MIPFEHVLEWTYGSLLLWWLGAFMSMTISSILGAIIDKGIVYYILSAFVGFLFYWWLSWLFFGQPIWDIAAQLSQPIS